MNKQFIDAALELDRLAIKWQAEFTPTEALEFLGKADAYNAFTTESITSMIATINAAIPRKYYQPGNLNNGSPSHVFTIGNEYSRVVYVSIVKTYLPDDFDYSNLSAVCDSAARLAGADEFNTLPSDACGWAYRIWFD